MCQMVIVIIAFVNDCGYQGGWGDKNKQHPQITK